MRIPYTVKLVAGVLAGYALIISGAIIAALYYLRAG